MRGIDKLSGVTTWDRVVSASAASAAPTRDPLYRGYRFPAEIIGHAVWLYDRFHLSHRDVEELLAERGIQVSYEAIRLWCRRFGPLFAAGLRRRRSRTGDCWHLDGGGQEHRPGSEPQYQQRGAEERRGHRRDERAERAGHYDLR